MYRNTNDEIWVPVRISGRSFSLGGSLGFNRALGTTQRQVARALKSREIVWITCRAPLGVCLQTLVDRQPTRIELMKESDGVCGLDRALVRSSAVPWHFFRRGETLFSRGLDREITYIQISCKKS